ncbi:hypothetical protein HWV62_32963 [Athelia sp. TMB]|nr:hypothetical protein HWV62_32963 [Athelia sp. TMB]
MTKYLTGSLKPVQGVDHLKWSSTAYAKLRAKVLPNLYVEVYIGQKLVARTTVVKRNVAPIWAETLTIPSAQSSSTLTLKLKHKSAVSTDSCFGIINETVGHLLQLCEGKQATQLKLQHGLKKAWYDAEGFLSAHIEETTGTQARENNARVTEKVLERLQPKKSDTSLEVISKAETLAANADQNADVLVSLWTILDKIQRIADVTVNAVDALAKVHPYADAAWKLLSAVYKAYKHQKETDATVVGLFKQMENLYSFVGDIESLPNKIQLLGRTVVRVLEQTTECAIFFREYTDRGFAARLIGQAVKNRSKTISDLSAALNQLQDDLKSGLQLHTAFVSSQTRDGVDRLGESAFSSLREDL